MMSIAQKNTHVFIVRIWVEPREIEGANPEMRGVVEHMESGSKYYFKNLYELLFYLAPHLEEMGVETESILRLKRFFR